MSTNTRSMMTVADLEVMPDDCNRYELMEGEIFVSLPPGLTHQRALGNLLYLLQNYLRKNPIGEVFTTPGVTFDQFNSVIPDITYSSNERMAEIAPGEHIAGAPNLMVEFVSPGSRNAKRDRVLKRRVYGKQCVQEYWIVDPLKRSVEVYRLSEESLELVVALTGNEELVSPLLPGLTIPLISIFGAQTKK
jgi:Uma2 family endonuclease